MKNKDKQIVRVHRVTDIIISAFILAAGAILMKYAPSLAWLGITLLFCGVIMVPFYRTGYKLKGIDGIFLKKEYLLPNECKKDISSFVEGKTDDFDINPFHRGGLLLELYSNKDKSKMYGQLFNYETNVYAPQSALSELNMDKLDILLKYQS